MTDNNDNKLAKVGKLGPLRVGFAAKLDEAKKQGTLASELFDCTKYPNRLVLCIDDSGSMGSPMEAITKTKPNSDPWEQNRCNPETRMQMCRKACEEFLNVCDSRDTALGMYTISTGQEFNLSIAYPMLLAEVRKLVESGGFLFVVSIVWHKFSR